MGFWIERYSDRVGNTDFIQGLKAGILEFAIWRNGEQLVGCTETPLREVLKDIDNELGVGNGNHNKD